MKIAQINYRASIKAALTKINKEQVGTLIVVDEKKRFLGTLSDGDLRRAILSNKTISKSITNFYQKNSTYFFKGEYNLENLRKIILKENYDYIPILHKSMKIFKVVELKDCEVSKITNKKTSGVKNIPVIIMAGGLGTRLKPFTSILPKPLIPINNKPIIRHIIESLSDSGIEKFWISLNYKSVLLKSYFKEVELKEKIKFVEEKKPLGTIGAVKLIENKLAKDFFITNCDTIIKTNYSDIYKFHKKNKFDLTIVASLKKYVIPYGVCEINKNHALDKLNEKPNYDLLVNTGLYMMRKNLIDLIPSNKKYDINHIITDLKKKNKKIGVYPISSDSWIDVGQWSEYKDAIELLNY